MSTPTAAPAETSTAPTAPPAGLPISPAESPPDPTERLTPAEKLTIYLNERRADLIQARSYLGDTNFKSNADKLFTWQNIGRDNCLVTKDSVDAVKVAQEAALAAEMASDTDEAQLAVDIPTLKMAELSTIVELTEDDFWMMACGQWKRPTSGCPEFRNMKLSSTGTAPEHASFHSDFGVALDSLQVLIKQSAKRNLNNMKGLFVDRNQERKVKFRHILFGERGAKDDDTDIPDKHKIENWPAVFGGAKTALQYMKSTHYVLPLPAYDMRGALLSPELYQMYLQGAVVQVHFNLKHWVFNDYDAYAADVTNMRVLVPPKSAGPITPHKRRIPERDPLTPGLRGSSDTDSPNKKSRLLF